MLGRAAMLNPSIFRSLGSDSLPRLEVSRQYLRYAISTGNSFYNTKFTLLSMWEPAGDTGQKIVASKSMCTLFDIFALDFAELELNVVFKSSIRLPVQMSPNMFLIGSNLEFRAKNDLFLFKFLVVVRKFK